jgi:pyrroloquinoline quinone biosynthesis protein E
LKERVDEIYLSLHGTPEYHEEITQAKGSFEVIEETIRKYVSDGIKVHSDTCLTKDSADMIFDIAERAASLGMTTLFINIFQPAGIGAHSEEDNAPSLSQIRHAITQMIRARDELGLNVSFGTSTPFCLDERLITEGLAFQCGTGDWFASIDPNGELRICNQSRRSYGNILEQPLHEIWHESNIDQDYRNIGWVEEPCNSCVFKEECLGGCRVPDSGEPRIDRIVKRNEDDILNQEKLEDLLPVYESTTYSQPYG